MADATGSTAPMPWPHHIHRVKPDLIVTFGPDGLTGHPTTAPSAGGRRAARAAARPEADLWYATVTDQFHDRWGRSTTPRASSTPTSPTRRARRSGELVHHANLTDDLLDLKVEALTAHTTQTAALIERIGPDDLS